MDAVLLDTHALLWAAADGSQLGREARNVMENPATDLWVSAASWWELAIKVRAGKLPQGEILLARRQQLEETLGAKPLAIKVEHALLAGQLSWPHKDPFDRMLAAQALHESLPLISVDTVFDDVAGLKRIWQ